MLLVGDLSRKKRGYGVFKVFRLCFYSACVTMASVPALSGEILLDSGNKALGLNGSAVFSAQVLGQAIAFSHPVRIDEIEILGGVAEGGSILVQLTTNIGPETLPSDVVSSFRLTALPGARKWLSAQVDIRLDQGDYFLVFSNFDDDHAGYIATIRPSIIDESYLAWNPPTGQIGVNETFPPASQFSSNSSFSWGVRVRGVVVPEPSSLLLALLTTLGLSFYRRRRRRAF